MSFKVTRIDPVIQKKLFDRINALNREGTQFSPLEPQSSQVNGASLDAMLTKACWARVISAVPGFDKDGNKTGKLFRLSSAFNSDGEGSFSPLNKPLASQDNLFTSDPTAMFRPHTGIVGITTSQTGKAIQKVTINWKLHDIRQFEKYQNALLKHGRIVTVEFGWSNPTITNTKPDFSIQGNMNEVYNMNQEMILTMGGDYYVTTGKITTFSFELENSGAYNCTTELTAMSNDMFSAQSNDDPDKTPVKINTKGSDIETAMKKANNSFINYIKALDENVRVADEAGHIGVYYEPGYGGWCNWAWFEDTVLNTYFSFKGTGQPTEPDAQTPSGGFQSGLLMEIRTKRQITLFGSDGRKESVVEEPNLCRYHSDLSSIDLDVCLPGSTTKMPPFDVTQKPYRNMSTELHQEYKNLHAIINNIDRKFPRFKDPEDNYGIIRNFVFSTKFLKGIWGNGITTVESGLNSHWNSVSAKYGGFWQFKAMSDPERNSRISVTDEYVAGTPAIDNTNPNVEMGLKSDPKTGNYNGTFEFSIYGKNSIMKDFNLSVNHSSKMATMATFHSNKNPELDTTMMQDELAIRALAQLNNANVSENSEGSTPEEVDSKDEVLQSLYSPYMQSLFNTRSDTTDQDSSYVLRDISDDELGFMADVTSDKENSAKMEAEIALTSLSEKLSEEAEGKNYWYNETADGVADRVIYDKNGTMLDIYSKTMLGKINNRLVDPNTGKATVHPIVPIGVSFNIPGIAGLKMFDLFTLDYLPKAYKERCMFQIMKTSHTVSTTGWTTGVEAVMRIDMTKVSEDLVEKGIEVTTEVDNEGWLELANKADEDKVPEQ